MNKKTVDFDIQHLLNINTNFDYVKGKNIQCKLTAVAEDGCSIIIEQAKAAKGHNVELSCLVKAGRQKIQFQVDARIESCENIDKSGCEIYLHFLKYNKDLWESILSMIQSEQDKLNQIFENMRDIA